MKEMAPKQKKYMIEKFLEKAVELGASDLHIKPNSPPKVRVLGKLVPLIVKVKGVVKEIPLTEEDCKKYVEDTMDEKTRTEYETNYSADYAIQIEGLGRCRVNASHTMGSPSLVARILNSKPKTIEELKLPNVLNDIAKSKNGIILVTGATGSGKSATLSAIIHQINKEKPVSIITIEDPVETLHTDIKASIMQKEVGKDTKGFVPAMREAMRQDPDIILVGEMRDEETVKTALHAAETGHLVLSTLHTTSASDTINRIVDFFPPHEHKQIMISLSESLRAIISQRLILTADGKSRIPALELLRNEGQIPEAISKGEISEIRKILKEDRNRGMQTFESSLLTLIQEGIITPEEALNNTKNPHDFQVELQKLQINVK